MDTYDKENPTADPETSDRQKTSMSSAIEVFDKTFWKGMCSTIRVDMKNKADKISAMNIDY